MAPGCLRSQGPKGAKLGATADCPNGRLFLGRGGFSFFIGGPFSFLTAGGAGPSGQIASTVC